MHKNRNSISLIRKTNIFRETWMRGGTLHWFLWNYLYSWALRLVLHQALRARRAVYVLYGTRLLHACHMHVTNKGFCPSIARRQHAKENVHAMFYCVRSTITKLQSACAAGITQGARTGQVRVPYCKYCRAMCFAFLLRSSTIIQTAGHARANTRTCGCKTNLSA